MKKFCINILLLLSFNFILHSEIIDSFNSVSSWYTYEKNGNLVINIDASGYSGNCMSLSYTFTGSPGKVSAKKDGVYNFSLVNTFNFFLKNFNSTNKIYFKVKDSDGTKFAYLVATNKSITDWTNISINKSDMVYDANSSTVGNDTILSWDKVVTVEFRIEGTQADTTLIDELSYTTLSDKTSKDINDNIIKSVKILYNPYDPVNDGNNRITINLMKNSQLKIVVYNLSGEIVSKINDLNFQHYYNSGDNEFYWNGKDENGNYLKNGLYFIYIKAISSEGEESIHKLIFSILK